MMDVNYLILHLVVVDFKILIKWRCLLDMWWGRFRVADVQVPPLVCIIPGVVSVHPFLHLSYAWTSAEHTVSHTFWDLTPLCSPIWIRSQFGVTRMIKQSSQQVIFITVKTLMTHLSRTSRGRCCQYTPVGSTVKRLQRFSQMNR